MLDIYYAGDTIQLNSFNHLFLDVIESGLALFYFCRYSNKCGSRLHKEKNASPETSPVENRWSKSILIHVYEAKE